jgi:hypothetical protein
VAAEDLERPQGIAIVGLGQRSENICPLEADVAQEMIIQATEGDNMPTVPGCTEEVEDGGG